MREQLIDLPYGARPLRVRLPADAGFLEPPKAPPPGDLGQLMAAALAAPIGAPRLSDTVAAGARVTIIVSDATRDEPRAAMVAALLDALPPVQVTLAIANGTHAPASLDALGLGPVLPRIAAVVNHDATDESLLVSLGETARGTPIQVHRCLVDSDLVVATGRIRPHYFAGYGAGAKAIFPGLGGATAIRLNHRLKSAPGAAPGAVDGNPCRDDLEEAADRIPVPTYLLDVVLDAGGGAQHAVAGHLREAFRVGARLARPLFAVETRRSACIVVSDRLPVTASLYQASKLVAAVAPALLPGGTIVLAAACPDGIGPLDAVNRGIYELGLRPRLPSPHQVVLVSDLPPDVVATSYCRAASSVESSIGLHESQVLIAPAAASLIVEITG